MATLLLQVRADTTRTKPCCIIIETVKGKGISYMEPGPGWHLGDLAPGDKAFAAEELKERTAL